jgi:general stress protein 26
MSVRLSIDEAWKVVERSSLGIFTTLRKDGSPVALPVWFVVLDRSICIGAASGTKKITRVKNDPRASFLVESGERWAELEAVHLNGTVEIVADTRLQKPIAEAIDVKYRSLRTPSGQMPDATRDHYAQTTYLRLIPDRRPLSWNNRKLGMQ